MIKIRQIPQINSRTSLVFLLFIALMLAWYRFNHQASYSQNILGITITVRVRAPQAAKVIQTIFIELNRIDKNQLTRSEQALIHQFLSGLNNNDSQILLAIKRGFAIDCVRALMAKQPYQSIVIEMDNIVGVIGRRPLRYKLKPTALQVWLYNATIATHPHSANNPTLISVIHAGGMAAAGLATKVQLLPLLQARALTQQYHAQLIVIKP